MPTVTVGVSIVEPRSKKGVYFKQDGKRFGSDRTIKVCTDVKYDIRVTVKPSVAPLRNLIIGGDDLSVDSTEQKESQSVYQFTWFTNGYTPTRSGQRHDVRFAFLFDGAELATSFQLKFYAVTSSTHLTWGTEVKQIQIEGRGEFGSGSTGAIGFETLTPTNVNFF